MSYETHPDVIDAINRLTDAVTELQVENQQLRREIADLRAWNRDFEKYTSKRIKELVNSAYNASTQYSRYTAANADYYRQKGYGAERQSIAAQGTGLETEFHKRLESFPQ